MTTKQKAIVAIAGVYVFGVVLGKLRGMPIQTALLWPINIFRGKMAETKLGTVAATPEEIATASGVTPATPAVETAAEILANPAQGLPTLSSSAPAAPVEIIPPAST